jgi:hypothetical protein
MKLLGQSDGRALEGPQVVAVGEINEFSRSRRAASALGGKDHREALPHQETCANMRIFLEPAL